MKQVLSENESLVLGEIVRFTSRSGVPPTIRELAASTGLSWSGARGLLRALHRKGFIHIEPGKRRHVRVLHES